MHLIPGGGTSRKPPAEKSDWLAGLGRANHNCTGHRNVRPRPGAPQHRSSPSELIQLIRGGVPSGFPDISGGGETGELTSEIKISLQVKPAFGRSLGEALLRPVFTLNISIHHPSISVKQLRVPWHLDYGYLRTHCIRSVGVDVPTARYAPLRTLTFSQLIYLTAGQLVCDDVISGCRTSHPGFTHHHL